MAIAQLGLIGLVVFLISFGLAGLGLPIVGMVATIAALVTGFLIAIGK